MQKPPHDPQMLNMRVINLIKVLYCITAPKDMTINNLKPKLYSRNIAFDH